MTKQLVGRFVENLQNRYWIFIIPHYYPRGGMNDFYTGTNKLKHVGKLIKDSEQYRDSFIFESDYRVEVLDTETNKVLTLEYK